VLTLTCCSLCTTTARALDLPDPYGPFGFSRGALQPPPPYRSFGAPADANERKLAEQPHLSPLHESTFWQRLADYKVRGGIRVLTLLDLHGSTLALQAGHGARPSLQWTSRRFRTGGSARGLLDRLFTIPPHPLEAPVRFHKPEEAPRPVIGQ
jgi:hypothetical protein